MLLSRSLTGTVDGWYGFLLYSSNLPVQAAEQSTNMRKNICFKVFFMILQDFQNCTLTLNPIVLVDGSMNESKLW